MSLDPRNPGLEQLIPHPGLLAIVMAILPALAMVQIMVLDNKVHVTQPEQPRPGIDRRGNHPQAAVAQHLREDDVLLADPPLVEAHREPHQLHREVRDERRADDIDELLHRVRVRGQQRIRVLGQVVRAMELPQVLCLVRRAVHDVVPEVEGERIHARLEDEPVPADAQWAFVGAVGEEDGEHGPEHDHREEGLHGLADAHVWNAIAGMLVAVEEPDLVPDASENVGFVHGDEL